MRAAARGLKLVVVLACSLAVAQGEPTPPPPPPMEQLPPPPPPMDAPPPEAPRADAARPGFHEVKRVRKGLLIPGAVMLGVSYVLSVFFGMLDAGINSGDTGLLLMVPLVGPTIWGVVTDRGRAPNATYLGLFDSLVQVAGLTMLVLGVALKATELVPDEPATALRLEVAPGAPGSLVGASVRLTGW